MDLNKNGNPNLGAGTITQEENDELKLKIIELLAALVDSTENN